MSRPEEDAGGESSGVPLVVAGFGGFLTVATGLAVTVLAFVLVNAATGGNLAIATLSLLGILVGVVIYYLGLDELFQAGQ